MTPFYYTSSQKVIAPVERAKVLETRIKSFTREGENSLYCSGQNLRTEAKFSRCHAGLSIDWSGDDRKALEELMPLV
jgi:hypothetical protein